MTAPPQADLAPPSPRPRGWDGLPSHACLLAGLLVAAAPALGQSRWSTTYGGDAREGVLDLVEAADGTLHVAAVTDSFGTATGESWWLHLAADGSLLDERAHGNTALNGAQGAALAPDGSVVFVGRHVIDLFQEHRAWAKRVDGSGVVTWAVELATFPGRHSLEAVTATPDGGWIAAGWSSEFDFPPIRAWAVKISPLGGLDWQLAFGGGGTESAHDVIATSDGGYALAGSSTSSGAGSTDAWVLKLDADGAIEWERTFGTTEQEEAWSIVELAAGGYAVAGSTDGLSGSGHSPWLLRLDAAGDVSWHDVFGDSEWGDLQHVLETADGDLVVTGRISAPDFGSNDLWLARVREADGAITWQRAYQGPPGAWGERSLALADGGFLVAGAWGVSAEDVWLTRTDGAGLVTPCELSRDVALVPRSPRFATGTGTVTAGPPDPLPVPQPVSFEPFDTTATVVPRCVGASCVPLACGEILTVPDPACGPGDVGFEATFTGGEGAVTASWDFDGDGREDRAGNPVTWPLPEGTTTVSVTLSDECPDAPASCRISRDVVVHPDLTPTITPSGPTSFCAARGESVILEVPDAYDAYQWWVFDGPVPGGDRPSLQVTESGEYRVEVRDPNGCTWQSDPVLVDAEACDCAPLTCGEIEIAPDPACGPQVLTFTSTATGGEGALVHEWDFTGDGQADLVGNPVERAFDPGTWPVALTVRDECVPDAQECRLTVDAVVHPDRTPVITADGPTRFCAARGERVTLRVADLFVDYRWRQDGIDLPSDRSFELDVTASGTYDVVVTDADGCTWTAEAVAVDAEACACPELTCDGIVASPDPACGEGTQSFTALTTGGEGALQYSWDFTGDGGEDAAGNPAEWTFGPGTWPVRVTVSDACITGAQDCMAETQATVHPERTPGIDPPGPLDFCAARGESAVLELTEAYPEVQWTRDGADLPGATGDALPVGESGSYAVRVVDENGCPWTSAPVSVVADSCTCAELRCESILVDPEEPCEGTLQVLTAIATGGEGSLTVEWDLDGDDIFEVTSPSVEAAFPAGANPVAARVTDECADPRPRTCRLDTVVTVLPGEPPGEVSSVQGGAPPLRVGDAGARLTFERHALASAYNVHAGAIGRWYAPAGHPSSSCSRRDAVDLGDGTVALELAEPLPPGTWVVVTASTACAEGTAGRDSLAVRRETVGTWSDCGGAP